MRLPLVSLAILVAGCQQQMAVQPAYRPLEASPFFADGRASRPNVEGVVARGSLEDAAYAYRRNIGIITYTPTRAASLVGGLAAGPRGLIPGDVASGSLLRTDEFAAEFPTAVTLATMRRGKERFMIYCAVCHGADGQGDGPIVVRGYTAPPSLVNGLSRRYERRGASVPLRTLPAGYYVAVMTEGFGAMGSYASQVRPDDRWAIAAYIRALQLSQAAPIDDLPEDERRAAAAALEKKS